MKTLVIYYSYEGSTRLIAETIAKELKADTLELKPKKEMRSHGFMKYFWGGKQVMLQQKPALEKFDKDPNEYEMIIFGTPVWAFNFAPVYKTFFSEMNLSGKKMGLFCCHDGNKGKTFENMKAHLNGNEILGEIEFEGTSKNKESCVNKAKEWARSIM